MHKSLGQAMKELVVRRRWPAIRISLEVEDQDQVDIAGVVEFHAAEFSQSQGHESSPSAVTSAGRSPFRFQFRPGRPNRSLTDRIRQVRNLPGHDLDSLLGDDVAIRNPQRLASLVAPQRGHHVPRVTENFDFAAEFLDQHLAGDRLPLGHPQQVIRFRIVDEQVAEVSAGGGQLQQDRERFRFTLDQRAERERAARSADKSFERIQCQVGIARSGKVSFKLSANNRQQVQGQPGFGHACEIEVPSIRILDSQGS